MATPRKKITDYERFMHAMKRVCGSPKVRITGDKFGTKEKETWSCPSCRARNALTLTYPEWLDYPKPRCENCSDRDIYEALSLQELAYRGSSAPLVYCNNAKAYRKNTGRWPPLTNKAEGIKGFGGACRRCSGCVEFERRRQAVTHASIWAERIEEIAEAAEPQGAWGIRIPENDFRRVMDQLRYHAKPLGGAVLQVPVPEGRAIVAVFSAPRSGRVTPLIQRLVREGVRFRRRERLPTDPYTGFVEIGIHEQVEAFLAAAFNERRIGQGNDTVKARFIRYERPENSSD